MSVDPGADESLHCLRCPMHTRIEARRHRGRSRWAHKTTARGGRAEGFSLETVPGCEGYITGPPRPPQHLHRVYPVAMTTDA